MNGQQWMRLSNSDFPVKTYVEMSLDGSDLKRVNEGMLSPVNPNVIHQIDFQSDAFLAKSLGNSSQSLTAFEWRKDSVDYTEHESFLCKKLLKK